jgi:long-chain acyl-CoA synthetase
MFHRLLALPDETRAAHDVSSLTFVLHSAAPCPVLEKRAMLDWWGPVLYEYYSSTEGGGTTVRPEDWLEHPGTVGRTVGRAWDGAEIAILDEAGRELPPGETGLVYIRNNEPFVYHNAPEKTARARREAGART